MVRICVCALFRCLRNRSSNRTRAQILAQPNKGPSLKCLIRCPQSPVDRSGVQIVPSDDMAPTDTCMKCGMSDATCLTMGTVSVYARLFFHYGPGPLFRWAILILLFCLLLIMNNYISLTLNYCCDLHR